MAYLEENERQKTGTMDVLAQNPQELGGEQEQELSTGGGQSAQVGAAPMSAPSVAPTQSQRTNQPKAGVGSGAFTNLQSYIQKNKPASQGIAQGISQNIQQQKQQQQQVIQSGRQQFQQQAGQLDAAREAARKKAIETVGRVTAPTPFQPLADEDITRYRDIITGVQDFDTVEMPDFTEQQQFGQTLQQRAQQAGTEQGRSRLLEQTFNQPTYTRGQRKLDQLLLQGNVDAQRGLQRGLEQGAQQFQQELGQTQEQLTQQQQQLTEAEQALVSELEGLAASGYEGFTEDIQQRAAEQNRLVDQIRGIGQGGVVSGEVLQALGLDQPEFFGIDPTTYLENVDPRDIVTAEDVAKYNALARLSGVEPDAMQFTEAGQVTRGVEDLKRDIGIRRDEFERRQQEVQSNIDLYNNLLDRMTDLTSSRQFRFGEFRDVSDNERRRIAKDRLDRVLSGDLRWYYGGPAVDEVMGRARDLMGKQYQEEDLNNLRREFQVGEFNPFIQPQRQDLGGGLSLYRM